MDGADLLVLIDGLELCENDLCMPDTWPEIALRFSNRPAIDGLEVLLLGPSDLSRASSRLPAVGENNTAAVTAARAARDRILSFMDILLLPDG